MKLPARIVAWVLPLLLSGCFLHKTPKAPPLVLAPDLGASKLPPPGQEPPPEGSIPTKPTVNATNLPEQTAKPPVRRRKPPAATDTENTDTQQATAPAEVSAIGQLSSGDPSDLRQKTEASIYATERSLNSINRRLNDQEQKTAEHIREFIKQAKAALATGDVDGASTLAAKAKVLLTELQR
jgi:hypothetical protein